MAKDKKIDKQSPILSELRLGQKLKQYVYIVQSSKEKVSCKIGITNDLKRRLKEYNNMTGKSKDTTYQYLFTCEVKNMNQLENDIKKEFGRLREDTNKEMYFYNSGLFKDYVEYIKSHKMFVKQIEIKPEDKIQEVRIIKKTAPSLKERGLSQQNVMQRAQKINNDEFYTRYEDVEKEIEMYDNKIWKDKVVFCNCDDAVDTENDKNTSAFASYFIKNFKKLELNKLICTHYSGGIDLFNQGTKGYISTYIFTKTRSKESKEYPKDYTGSFDDPLSLKILNEEADIVCTNPPFSKAKEYWDITIKSGKKFLIISSITNALHTAYIHYFKNNKVWAGYNSVDWFLTPKRELTRATGYWYTNIPIKNRLKQYKNLKIIPLKDIPEKNKKYDDSKILIVSESYIPSDYKKPFAVSARQILNGILERGYKIAHEEEYLPYINGKVDMSKVLVQKI